MSITGGIVLCGGQSKRMGQPKCWLPIGGETLLQRVVRVVAEAVNPVVVVAAPDQELPTLPNKVTVVRDEERDRGPLQGLAAGLTALRGQCDAAYLSGCDVPFLRPALIKRMVELRGNQSICIPRVGDLFHPLAAVYRLHVLKNVRRMLVSHRMSLVGLLDEVATRIVLPEELEAYDPGLRSLWNLNTAEEYAAAVAAEATSDKKSQGKE